MEAANMKDAYGPDQERYLPRLMQLTERLREGRLNAAAELCKIDFSPPNPIQRFVRILDDE